MSTELIHDRGRGPEIEGTRITVYNLLPHFFDGQSTEAELCRLYELTPQQVAAARAYVFRHIEAVLSEHLKIESRIAEGNSPEVIEEAKQSRGVLLQFKVWLEKQDLERKTSANAPRNIPSFREWLATQPVNQGR